MGTVTMIDQYHVLYSSNKNEPRIGLIHAGQYIGQLIFKPNTTALPVDTNINNFVNLYYHLDDFHNALDLLRNEKPMYLWFNGSGAGYENGIQTSPEPVGEGEKATAA